MLWEKSVENLKVNKNDLENRKVPQNTVWTLVFKVSFG